MAKNEPNPDDTPPPPGFTLRHTLREHTSYINRIAWSPDGRFLATPSDDQTIRIWEIETGACIRTLEGHNEAVNSVAWSPDGRTLASGSTDTTVRVWNPGAATAAYYTLGRHSERVFAVAWSPDGESVASGSFSGLVQVWDAVTGTLHRKLGGVGPVYHLAWSPGGRTIACGVNDGKIYLWDLLARDHPAIRTLEGHASRVYAVAWSPDGRTLVSGSYDTTIRVWGLDTGNSSRILEGHASMVYAVAWSPDGRIVVSKSVDQTVRLWHSGTYNPIATLDEELQNAFLGVPAFHPTRPLLATFGANNLSVRIWELDVETLLRAAPTPKSQLYTSAKVVLVGESNVGKTSLATRLVEQRTPDASQTTTHGMTIHKVPAGEFHPNAAKPGESRDIVFWDFGGQDEYRLVHQMFLHDTALALILIDPTRGRTAFEQARDWNQRLMKQLGNRQAVKLLIGAKLDTQQSEELVDLTAIADLKGECGFVAYLPTSAIQGRGIEALREEIVNRIDWNSLGLTSRPELFQRIREEIEARQKASEIVARLPDLTTALRDKYPDLFEERAVAGVADQLALQGLVAKTQLPDKTEALVLRVDKVEQYAGSLIKAAMKRPGGVPMLIEDQIGAAGQRLPGMTKADRFPPETERVVLQCVAELMVRHGICFRHLGLLVFPTLFPDPPTDSDRAGKLLHSVSLWYDFTGAIDNIYASLVAGLMASDQFGPGRVSAGRVVFDHARQGLCGLRQIKRPGGLAHLDLFFGDDTKKPHKQLFIAFVEDHLRTASVDIREHQAIKCLCGEEITELTVQKRIAANYPDVLCPVCERRTLISEGVGRSQTRDPAAVRMLIALRKQVEKKLTADAEAARTAVALATSPDANDPVRILHLSDLHFSPDTRWKPRLQALMNDLTCDDLNLGPIQFLVVSGDFTDRGNPGGFDPAREFVVALLDRLKIPITRVVVVAGNHDVVNSEDQYTQRFKADGLVDGEYIPAGKVWLTRDRTKWPDRFRPFSEKLYHPLYQAPYPLEFLHSGEKVPEERLHEPV